MNVITQLWMPILATAVLIFIASSLIHMVFKWHNSDYRQLGNEDAVRAALGANQPGPGQYIVPYCADMKEMQGEAMMKKYIDGPVAWITVLKNGAPNMGKSLALWFVYTLLIAAFAGWLAMQSYGAGANSRLAAHLVGMVSFLAYASGSVQLGIWMGKPWASVAKDVLDGAIYGTISALVFMWLWP
jgi:hypothetical protein